MAKEKEQILRLRFRRTIQLRDREGEIRVHAANSVAAIEANDEAWAAVNKGDADLDPPPGVDGQPFPPKELVESPVVVPPPVVHGAPPVAAAPTAHSKDDKKAK